MFDVMIVITLKINAENLEIKMLWKSLSVYNRLLIELMGGALVTKHVMTLPKKSKVILYLAISLLYSISFRILVALAYTISMCSLVMSVCSHVLLIEKQGDCSIRVYRPPYFCLVVLTL